MLTIAQQRHSLTVTENRIMRAELSISTVRDMIQASLMGGSDTLPMQDVLPMAEQALKDLFEVRKFLIESIKGKERDLAKVVGSSN
ncbi:hypothetical protein LJ655_26265 [Paraburkholderia sp. MMS20-SJTN17]|uniref:Uncharacterized protein n=1 Tax=Paraburkholderia translucens TaxID=2886945 RepID=A0ABS8KKM4_9BURK|nr:hypothetical protein [Paraburkholderia sp. MMS20-SJTN17]MCC8405321.1 hypothetical protein [Paraburkholderia sp. MMS20-SJTN17]